MAWKHPALLALLTLCFIGCGGPASTEVPATAGQDTEDLSSQPPSSETPGDSASAPPRSRLVPQEYATIQAAVDAARAGDTVLVAPGTYSERVRLKSGIRLEGSGAALTVLDGQGRSENLVDFSGASDVVISGFTFRNVGPGIVCQMSADPRGWCSGDWYAAAVYADGHTPGTSGVITRNRFEGNDTAVLLYYRAHAEVRGNLFRNNRHALVFNYYGDELARVEDNLFWRNTELSLGVQAGYVDIRRNVIAHSGLGLIHEYIQTGDIRCNVFFQNARHVAEAALVPDRVRLGEDDNLVLDPLFADADAGDYRLGPGSPLLNTACFPGTPTGGVVFP